MTCYCTAEMKKTIDEFKPFEELHPLCDSNAYLLSIKNNLELNIEKGGEEHNSEYRKVNADNEFEAGNVNEKYSLATTSKSNENGMSPCTVIKKTCAVIGGNESDRKGT